MDPALTKGQTYEEMMAGRCPACQKFPTQWYVTARADYSRAVVTCHSCSADFWVSPTDEEAERKK